VFSKEEYVQSLLEEQEKQRDYYQESAPSLSPVPQGTETFPVAETIAKIHQNEGGFVWAIFQCK
jgi:hypothetical protein